MNVYDVKTLDIKNKQYRQELLDINEDLIKLMLSINISTCKNFYNQIEEQGKKFRENIFWYLSAMQDIGKFANIYPKLEQELRDYKHFVNLQKQIIDLWFNNKKQNQQEVISLQKVK